MFKRCIGCISLIVSVLAFWDHGTTTKQPEKDEEPRTSFFRWQMTEFDWLEFWTPTWDWTDLHYRRRLNVVAGISIDFTPLGTATILNRRALVSSANYMEPHLNRVKDLRIWALGREGKYNTPYRYRVWRVRRLLPRSNNPEHAHGPYGIHVPRHDVAIIHSWDQMYVYSFPPNRLHYPFRAYMTTKNKTLTKKLHFAGSGFETMRHIRENYKIFYSVIHTQSQLVNCERYLPKWWGKFMCFRNVLAYPGANPNSSNAGVPNGGGLYDWNNNIVGIGCFEIRYNDDRIMVFTDLRYYVDLIYIYANYTPGEYYEYAYPQWSVRLYWTSDGNKNYPYIPWHQVQDDLYPLGRRK